MPRKNTHKPSTIMKPEVKPNTTGQSSQRNNAAHDVIDLCSEEDLPGGSGSGNVVDLTGSSDEEAQSAPPEDKKPRVSGLTPPAPVASTSHQSTAFIVQWKPVYLVQITPAVRLPAPPTPILRHILRPVFLPTPANRPAVVLPTEPRRILRPVYLPTPANRPAPALGPAPPPVPRIQYPWHKPVLPTVSDVQQPDGNSSGSLDRSDTANRLSPENILIPSASSVPSEPKEENTGEHVSNNLIRNRRGKPPVPKIKMTREKDMEIQVTIHDNDSPRPHARIKKYEVYCSFDFEIWELFNIDFELDLPISIIIKRSKKNSPIFIKIRALDEEDKYSDFSVLKFENALM